VCFYHHFLNKRERKRKRRRKRNEVQKPKERKRMIDASQNCSLFSTCPRHVSANDLSVQDGIFTYKGEKKESKRKTNKLKKKKQKRKEKKRKDEARRTEIQ